MRGLMKVLKWILMGVLLFVASWIAFNGPWADAPVRPRPAVLLQSPLPVGQPNAYALLLDASVRPQMPTDAPWQCAPHQNDCTEVWLAQAPALREQLKAAGPFATVCESALAENMSWTEPARKVPEINPAAFEMPNFKTVTTCLRWMRAQATLAVVDRDDARALSYLRRADRAVRGSLDGAQTLLGHAIAWAAATAQWQTVAALVHVRPQLAGPALELLRPLNPAALNSTRWIAGEAAMSQAILKDLVRGCVAARAGVVPYQGWIDRIWCEGRLGYLPELTRQEADAMYVELADQARDGALAAVANEGRASGPEPSYFAWRNTMGRILVAVARPTWGPYFRRQADVELVREAAELAVKLTAHPLPAEGRQAWLDAQHLSPFVASRITLAGGALIVLRWHDDGDRHGPVAFQLPAKASTN